MAASVLTFFHMGWQKLVLDAGGTSRQKFVIGAVRTRLVPCRCASGRFGSATAILGSTGNCVQGTSKTQNHGKHLVLSTDFDRFSVVWGRRHNFTEKLNVLANLGLQGVILKKSL